MRLLFSALFAALVALTATAAHARPPEVERAFPGAELVGEARYRMLAWTLFDAALWSENGAFAWDRPFALTLTYRQSFSAQALADRTLVEMSGRGAGAAPTPLRERLLACFADVRPGDRITGVSAGADRARFYYNGARRCEIEWPGFRRSFFGIWLDASGDARALSARLRGAA